MNDNTSNNFFKIIDERIERYMKTHSSNIVYKYAAIVTGFEDGKVKVKIPCYEMCEFRFLNKSGVQLAVNDSVFIETVGNNLTNGFISEKFGK